MRHIKAMLYSDDAGNAKSNKGPLPIPPITPSTNIIELFKGVASKDIKESAENNKKDENKKG